MKILIDSDVCLDFLTGRKPFYEDAIRLFSRVENTNLNALVSPDSFSNMFYILRKEYEPKNIITKFKQLRMLVFVAFLSENIIDSAIHSGWKDFEDSLQYYCAQENSCNAIVTRNIKDFSESELPVFTPADFLNRFDDKEE